MRSFALLTLFLIYLPPVFVQPFCGILLWTWFSIMNPHRLVWGIGSVVPYAMLIALVTIGAWLASKEPKAPPASAVLIALVGMMFVIAGSTFFALSPQLAFGKFDIVIKTLVMCYLTLTLLTNKVRIHAFIWVMVLSLGYYGFKGGIFAVATAGAYRVWGPEQSYIYDNNHIALALVMVVPLMYFLQLQSKHRFLRLGLMGLQGCTVVAALMSYSRGGLLAMSCMGLLFWWRSPNKFSLGLLMGLLIAGIFTFAPAAWFERMNTISHYGEDDSAMGRINIWAAGLKIVAERPILGGGFRATYRQEVIDRYDPSVIARAVHNSHLEVLIENGVLGFICHLTLIGATWFSGQHIRRLTARRDDMRWHRDLAAMLQTSLAGYVTGGTFLSLGYYDGWYNIAIAMAALHAVVVRQVKEEQASQAPAFARLQPSQPATMSFR